MSQIATGGKVDWDKVKITENGGKAQVAIASIGATIQLAKVNGKWYLDQETFAQDAAGIKEMTGTLMNVLDQIEQKVKSGQISKQNFIQEYQDIINGSLGSGKKSPASIVLGTSVPRVIVKEVGGVKKFKDLLEAMSAPETDDIKF